MRNQSHSPHADISAQILWMTRQCFVPVSDSLKPISNTVKGSELAAVASFVMRHKRFRSGGRLFVRYGVGLPADPVWQLLRSWPWKRDYGAGFRDCTASTPAELRSRRHGSAFWLKSRIPHLASRQTLWLKPAQVGQERPQDVVGPRPVVEIAAALSPTNVLLARKSLLRVFKAAFV